jgi:hypothetical protein
LDDLLDFVVKLGLGSDFVKLFNELLHDLLRVVSVLGGHHADEVHDAFDETGVVEVQVDDQALEDVLMRIDKVFTKLFEQLSVPLNDGFLLLTIRVAQSVISDAVLFLKPLEDVFEFVFVVEDLDDGAEEAAIDIFNELFVARVNPA